MNVAANRIFFVALFLAGFASAIFAGPQPIADQSKGKEVQMEQAPVCDPRWYISVGGGADFNVGNTTLSQGFDARNIDFQTSAFIKKSNFDDAYGTGWHGEGEIGYALTEHLELFGRFRYAHADANSRVGVGDIVSDFSRFAGPILRFPVSLEFDDYDSWGGELGFRFFFLPRQSRLRPYVALSAGASHVDNIDIAAFIDLRDIGGPADERVFRGGYFNESWVATGSAVLGMELNVNCRWTLGVNGGVRYESRLDPNDEDLRHTVFFIPQDARVPLSFARPINNDAGDRWTVPVTGYVKFRF